MNDTQVNSRQSQILQFLTSSPDSSRAQIEAIFSSNPPAPSRITIIRDLNHLVDSGWVEQAGGGKYVTYSIQSNLIHRTPIDLTQYFETPSDSREVIYSSYHRESITNLQDLFSQSELTIFDQGQAKLKEKFASLNKTILKRELERFTIDLSWKSSQIEGNTYSLLETEELIKSNREAKGHLASESTMILNHKLAFDTILTKKDTFAKITPLEIRSIHAILTNRLDVLQGIREHAVGITGTKYLPIDNQSQLQEELDQLLSQIKQSRSLPERAFILLVGIAYLQPFADGNKRTSRLVSNAVLLSDDYYPLSYRSISEVEYKQALIVFYETGNIYHLKRLFIEQYQFAVENYFL